MLNERQKYVVVDKVNKDVNLPLISEGREERMIEDLLEKVLPEMEPALLELMPSIYVTSIKLGLDESLSQTEKKDQITDILRTELSEPFMKQLNARIDYFMIPECVEAKMLRIVADKLIEEIVASTFGVSSKVD